MNLMKRKFKVTVEGETYDVEVEEISEDEESGRTSSSAGKTEVKKKENTPSRQKTERVDASSGGSKTSTASSPDKSSEKTSEEEASDAEGDGGVEAPMAGKVLELKVSEGEKVSQGDLIMILEAMKMENEVYAPRGGTVKNIAVSDEESVDAGDHIMSIE